MKWEGPADCVPAVRTAVMMAFTYSIGIGFVAHMPLRLITGRVTEINPPVAIVAIYFVVSKYFV